MSIHKIIQKVPWKQAGLVAALATTNEGAGLTGAVSIAGYAVWKVLGYFSSKASSKTASSGMEVEMPASLRLWEKQPASVEPLIKHVYSRKTPHEPIPIDISISLEKAFQTVYSNADPIVEKESLRGQFNRELHEQGLLDPGKSVYHLGTRTPWHLKRLLRINATGPEIRFAEALIDHADGALKGIFIESGVGGEDMQLDILRVINGDRIETTAVWWTFAPHLFNSLTCRGIAADQAIKMTLQWTMDIPDSESAEVSIPGLEPFDPLRMPLLNYKNPHCESHRIAARVGERLADYLLQ